MEEKKLGKRRPIEKKVRSLVLTAAFLSVLIIVVISLRSVLSIWNQTAGVLEQMEQNLLTIAKSKTEYAEVELGQYESYAESFANYIGEMYAHPENYVKRDVVAVGEDPTGGPGIHRILVSEDIDPEDVKEEGELLANAEMFFYPVICSEKNAVISCYVATESGQMIFYEEEPEIRESVYYYYNTLWYDGAKEAQKAIFTQAYIDGFGRGLVLTCAAPFYNGDGKFMGVVAMDIEISDLYNSALSLRLKETSGAKAFLLSGDGGEITPGAIDEDMSVVMDVELELSVIEKILKEKEGVFTDTNRIYYAFSQIENTGWEYCIKVPMQDLLATYIDLQRSIFIAFAVMVLAILAAIPLEVFIVSKAVANLTNPIIELGKDADEISAGNFDHKAKIYDNDEIGDLAVNLNEMAASLKQYIADIEKITAEEERISAELNIAKQIQADALPSHFPPFPDRKEFDIFATMVPAKEVGGDFYDFFMPDDDHIVLVMADVAGKGVPAALFMMTAKTLIKTRAQMGQELSPAKILTDVNERLCEGNEAALFVTVWLAVIELSTGRGVAANAGHEHPALRRAGGKYELVRYRHSLAVAAMEGVSFREHEFALAPGDSLYVYTDGVAEATDASEELFGTDRLLAALNREPDAGPEALLAHVKEGIDDFVKDTPQFDDITMLAFAYHGCKN